MLGPDSRLLIVLLVVASAALMAAVIWLHPLAARLLCAVLSMTVAMAGGVVLVNYYYGYYTTWGELRADFYGGSGGLGVISTTSTTASARASGRIGWITLPGKLSGYSRRGLLYLPPQYGQSGYARVRFPVAELFHGSPGSPLSWDTLLRISQVVNSLLARHLIGPMVLVMPSINGSDRDYQDCVNGPGVSDETYLTQDVRSDLLARYRVSADPFEWGVGGYSSGGYCAANLALRHRGSFGAAAVIEGYFRAGDGPAAAALDYSQSLETANSPLYLAERLAQGSGPVPAFWVAAGTHDKSDYQPATMFTAALDRIEQVPFYNLAAADSGNAWQAALPAALTWLWQQLAPPDLRVLFPVRTRVYGSDGSLHVRPAKTHYLSPCETARPGPAHLACAQPSGGQVRDKAGKTAVHVLRAVIRGLPAATTGSRSGEHLVPAELVYRPPPSYVCETGLTAAQSGSGYTYQSLHFITFRDLAATGGRIGCRVPPAPHHRNGSPTC